MFLLLFSAPPIMLYMINYQYVTYRYYMLYYFLRVTVLVTLVEPFARVVRVTRVVVLPVLLTLTVLRNTLDII